MKSLDPTWSDETFEWTGLKMQMGVLEVVVMDYDGKFSKDDICGSAVVNLAETGVLDEGVETVPIVVKLNTQGVVHLAVDWRLAAEDIAGDLTKVGLAARATRPARPVSPAACYLLNATCAMART